MQNRINFYGEYGPSGVDTLEARKYQTLANVAEGAAELSTQVGQKIRAEQGAKAGAKAGQELQEMGAPADRKENLLSRFSVFDQAYNEAMEASYIAGVTNDARSEIARLAAENTKNPLAFEQAANAYTQTLLGKVGPDMAPAVTTALGGFVSSAQAQIHREAVAFNLQEASDTMSLAFTNFVEDAQRYTQESNTLEAEASLANAYNQLDRMVAGKFINEADAQTLKREARAGVAVEQALTGLQTILKRQEEDDSAAVIGMASKYIDTITTTAVEELTVDQQNALRTQLTSEFNNYWTNRTRFASEEARLLGLAQDRNFTVASLGIYQGTTTQQDLNKLAVQEGISGTQLNTLSRLITSVAQNAIDNESTVLRIERALVSNPDDAQDMINDALIAGDLTGKTATRLSLKLDEAPRLSTPDAKRSRRFVQQSLGITDEYSFSGQTTVGQRRALMLELAYNELVMDGIDPMAAAFAVTDYSVQFNAAIEAAGGFSQTEKQMQDKLDVLDAEIDFRSNRTQSQISNNEFGNAIFQGVTEEDLASRKLVAQQALEVIRNYNEVEQAIRTGKDLNQQIEQSSTYLRSLDL